MREASDNQRPSAADSFVTTTSSVKATATGPIVVAIRKRPKIENREAEESDIVRCEAGSVAVYEVRTKLDLTPVVEPSLFSFDHVFDEAATNDSVYMECCQPLLQTVREGGGAVIFAFGQTGSGKTHTMLGRPGAPGLYSLAVTELLGMTSSDSLSVSFYEVYGAKLFDLLNDRAPVKMLQDEYKNIHVVGLTERQVRSVEDTHSLMTSGQLLRAIGTTHANDRSSRSHAVLEIKVQLPFLRDSFGRMTFVDLAGSERASDTAETDAKTRREGAEINKSLLALKECIRAMSMRKRHIPFRGSKLTQILRESFVGRSRTCVIATVSPCQSHCEDTLNTLRYADRIKELKCVAPNSVLNEAPTPCRNCGLPMFVGDRHVCRRQVVQCPHCRHEMDKGELEAHIPECKEFPLRCPHCNERMLRADLARHNRRCFRLPVRCAACGQQVPRSAMERHALAECGAAKEKCRYCAVVFPRQTLSVHEQTCDAMKIACQYCLQFVRKKGMQSHRATCLMNPNRVKVGEAGYNKASRLSRGGSVCSLSPSVSVLRDTPQQQQLSDGVASAATNISADGLRAPAGMRMETLKFTGTPSAAYKRREGSDALGRSPSISVVAVKGDQFECPYARFGCNERVSRVNLSSHLSERLSGHLQLVTLYAEKVDHENSELRRLVVRDNDPAAANPTRAQRPSSAMGLGLSSAPNGRMQ